MEFSFDIESRQQGQRLDAFLVQECRELSRSQLQKLIKEGLATVNDRAVKASLKLKEGDRVDLVVPPPRTTTPLPEDIPIAVVYEDDELIVLNKPPGLAVHPAPGHPSHTLVNALLARCRLAPATDEARPGIVHRLDKDTSGLMMVAKSESAYTRLISQLKNRMVTKRYLVLVRGHVSSQQGAIEASIGRSKHNRKRMAVTSDGREAVTYYRVVRYVGECTLVEATPKTGRTHQIRVHFSSIGHPVMGDATYGVKSPFLKRQFLHSHLLGFMLPSSGEYVEFISELPTDLQQALRQLSEAIDRRRS